MTAAMDVTWDVMKPAPELNINWILKIILLIFIRLLSIRIWDDSDLNPQQPSQDFIWMRIQMFQWSSAKVTNAGVGFTNVDHPLKNDPI